MVLKIKKTGAVIDIPEGILRRMLKFLTHIPFFCSLLLFIHANLSFAEDSLCIRKPSDVCDSAQRLLVQQKYPQASKLVSDHLKKNPRDNDALYLSFAIEQTRILD
ncbi:MAG TPA: hypothetical protein VHO70_17975, partial [Chitinispirillaceae bacterium]|nr:hypothetical protein [Chitinispirillaceae bacterium]